MIQFLADQLDQMDLALDQLMLKDRNYDRFALMLIDNVVELTLYEYARDTSMDAQLYPPDSGPRFDPKLISAALGRNFGDKVKLARTSRLVSDELADTLQYLHGFRNTAYHRGARHEGILHALALFYARSACHLLKGFQPLFWSSTSTDNIPHRAVKYLGSLKSTPLQRVFGFAWQRLSEVVDHHGDTLLTELYADMQSTIDRTDEQIAFLAAYLEPKGTTRDSVIIDVQLWPFAFSDQGEAFAAKNGGPDKVTTGYVAWIGANYPWPMADDPIPSWRNRAESLRQEKNHHAALKKYCEFIKQTDALRTAIDTSQDQLDSYIQHMVDASREEPHGEP